MVGIFFLVYFVRNTVGECKQSKELPENIDRSLYEIQIKSLLEVTHISASGIFM